MANRLRKCKCCGVYSDEFITVPAGTFKNIDHAMEFAGKSQAKVRARLIAKIKASDKKEAKAARAQHRKDKARVKPKSKHLADLQSLVNQYVRLRDALDGCISCDQPSTWQGQWHCSHYFSRGHSSALRFNLWNMHKSCSVCNSHLSGNIGNYTPRLIEKIGRDKFDWLTNNKSNVTRFEDEWIIRAKVIARKAIKREKAKLARP